MKKILMFVCSILLLIVFVPTYINVKAHDITLDVVYDDCLPKDYVDSSNIGDGYNEKWYELVKKNLAYHIPHSKTNTTEIKYYFSLVGQNSTNITWSTGISEELSNRIITEYRESMEKWNNVWYYVLNAEGLYEKRKLVNIVAGTENDHNLIIYPITYSGAIASTWPTSDPIRANSINSINHEHYTEWAMNVDISSIARLSSTKLNNILSRTGAHEIGHVLGLRDIDGIENTDDSNYHHEEILMGYAKRGDALIRQSNITYRDIAGVAITRWFHNDSNHLWLYDKDNLKDGKEKLICSLCNCVKYVEDLSVYNYFSYKQCGHSDTNLPTTVDKNMIPVASYGNTDYYKCKYCKYVAPFTSRIIQDYIYTGEYTENYHILENQSNNLLYKTFEEHNLINLGANHHMCSNCNYRNFNIFYECALSNYSSTINQTTTVAANETKYLKINSNYHKYYEFVLSTNHRIDIKLYDNEFNEINIDNLGSSNSIKHFIQNLQIETYYLAFINNTSISTSVSLKIQSRNTAYLKVGENDILVNSYNCFRDYNYVNQNHAGFFKFTLVGEKEDGRTIIYPSNTLRIYNDANKTQLLQKFDLEGYDNNASLKQNEDNMYVYLPRIGYFYLDVNFNTADLKSLKLIITEAEIKDLNLFNLSENTNNTINLINESKKGDFFEELCLIQKGKFSVTFSYSGTQNNNILVVLVKPNYNEMTKEYSLETKVISLLNKDNQFYTYTSTLEKGNYYIGYFNKEDTSIFTIAFERLVTQSGSEVLVTDPDYLTLAGSQINIVESNINIYDRSYRENHITVGFTRLIYPNYNYGISPSRLDYEWYSSDETIATVTNYGTVLGKSAGTVKIMAVLKSDPSKVYVKDFIILDDVGCEIIEIQSSYTVKYSRDVINDKFHFDIEKINCPYPWLQDYIWENFYCHSDFIDANMDSLGYINVNGTGCFTLIGTYKVNNRFKVIIHFVIEP